RPTPSRARPASDARRPAHPSSSSAYSPWNVGARWRPASGRASPHLADARRSKLGPQFVSEVLQVGDHVTGHAALLGLKLAHDAHEMDEQIKIGRAHV